MASCYLALIKCAACLGHIHSIHAEENIMTLSRIFVGLAFGLVSLSAVAAGTSSNVPEKCPCPPMDMAQHEPPARAFEDCKGKTEGSKLQHTLPNEETVAAVCVNSPKGLFARPDHPPRPEMHKGNR